MFEVLSSNINPPKKPKPSETVTKSEDQLQNNPQASSSPVPQINFNLVNLFPINNQEPDDDILLKYLESDELLKHTDKETLTKINNYSKTKLKRNLRSHCLKLIQIQFKMSPQTAQ